MALDVPSFLRAKMLLSVPMNGVLVPMTSCIENLQRFCRPLIFHNKDTDFDISFSGSSFLFRHKQMNLQLCCGHQLTNQNRHPDEIIMVVEDGTDGKTTGLSPSEATQATAMAPEFEDSGDMLLAEYRTSRDGRDLHPYFFNMNLAATPDLKGIPAENIHLVFTIGYPTRFTDYDTDFDEIDGIVGIQAKSRWAKIYLEPAERNAWDRPSLTPLTVHSGYEVDFDDPDGFSGSPVFFLYADPDLSVRLGFAGMIVCGNLRGRFNMLEAAQIRRAVRKHEIAISFKKR